MGEFLLQFSDNLSKSKRLGQAETVDLHTLSAKEARAAVLCVLCNIQVCAPVPSVQALNFNKQVLGMDVTGIDAEHS